MADIARIAAPRDPFPEHETVSAVPRYVLPVFEGPLDLLLYLLQKHEIDIYDIPIARITQQYQSYLDRMKELNLEIAAEFILMAATLIQIKSRMLMPRDDTEEESAVEDPRDALVGQLLEYQKYREVGRLLQEREEVALNRFPRGGGNPVGTDRPVPGFLEVDLFDLMDALARILKRASASEDHLVFEPEIKVTAKIVQILQHLERCGSLLFEELFDSRATRHEIVVSFLALLELVKRRAVLLFQESTFGSIRVVHVS